MEHTTIWFALIAFFWVGYFALEGFDFGVGMLLPWLPRDEAERRVLYNSIGPVWDGNEVWVLVAGGATFAAFPEWYATLFSGFYLPLLLILVALIVRALAFEYRHKRAEASWKRGWDFSLIFGSYVPALLWGIALANMVRGVPIDADHEYTGGLLTLVNPYGLLGGLLFVSLFLTHGLMYLALKTDGDIRHRAGAWSFGAALVSAVLAVAFLGWTQADGGNGTSALLFVVAAVALLAGAGAARARREGWAFAGTFVCIVLAVAGMFVALFPDVMPSTTDPSYSLTTTNAAATPYALGVMNWVALLFAPLVLCYQTWSYWVFRRRIGTQHIPMPTERSSVKAEPSQTHRGSAAEEGGL